MSGKKSWMASSLSLATASFFTGGQGETAYAEDIIRMKEPGWEKEQVAQEVLYQYLNPISSVSEGNMAVKTDKKPLYHKVKKGETLFGIGQRYGVDSDTLTSYNKIRDPRTLQPGKKLKVPVEIKRIRVKEKETLKSIAQKQGVSVDTLKKANPDSNLTDAVYVGQILEVPHVYKPNPVSEKPAPTFKKRKVNKTKPKTQLASSSSRESAPTNQSYSFFWPVSGKITSTYGMRHGKMHTGIDISNGNGTQNGIKASLGGTVTRAGYAGGYGNLVVVDHGSGWSTYYAHLSRIGVQKGQRVKQGDVLGNMGTTGNSTGVHLHFEVRRHDNPINPLTVLP